MIHAHLWYAPFLPHVAGGYFFGFCGFKSTQKLQKTRFRLNFACIYVRVEVLVRFRGS